MQRKVTFKDKYVNCSAVDIIYIYHHRRRRRWSCIYAPHLSVSPHIEFCIKLHFRCQTSFFALYSVKCFCTVVTVFKYWNLFSLFFFLFFFQVCVGAEESWTKQGHEHCAAVVAPARVSNSFTPVWKNKSGFYTCCSSMSFSSCFFPSLPTCQRESFLIE